MLSTINWVQVYANKWILFYCGLPWIIKCAIIVVAFLFIHLGILKPLWAGSLCKKTNLNFLYPSLLWAVLTAVISFDILLHVTHQERSESILFGAFYLCFIVYLCFLSLIYLFEDESVSKPTLSLHEFNQIKKWIKQEQPSTIDLFDHSVFVDRLARRIKKRNQEYPDHIILNGSFGVGKTTICKLLRQELNSAEGSPPIFVEIDGWGRQKLGVDGQILSKVVEKLSEIVDCTAIKSIPSHYVEAIENIPIKGAKMITPFLSHSLDPLKALGQLNNLLKIIDIRLIIILEDFDRGSISDGSWNRLAGLLDRLRKTERIGFIINTSENLNVKPAIIDRICTYREDITSVDTTDILKLFFLGIEDEVRKNDEKIYLPQSIHEFSLEGYNSEESILQYPFNLLAKVSAILDNPRKLKNCLRRTYETWQAIKGEALLVDILLINSLRVSFPELLDIIKTTNIGKDLRDKIKSLEHTEDTKTLLTNIFLGFEPWRHNPLSIFHQNRHETNLKRIFKEKLLNDKDSTQEIIRMILAVANDEDDRQSIGLRIVQEKDLSHNVLDFIAFIGISNEIPAVLNKFIRAALETIDKKPEIYNLYSFNPLINRLLELNSRRNNNYDDYFWSYIEILLSFDLSWAVEIAKENLKRPYRSESEQLDYRKRFTNLFCEKVDDVQRYLSRLDQNKDDTTSELLKIFYGEKKADGIDLILDVFEADPGKMYPQINYWFYKGIEFDNDIEKVRSTFGKKSNKLLSLCVKTDLPEYFPVGDIETAKNFKRWAEEQLKTKKDSANLVNADEQ
jgi:hypothetical protein